MGSENNKEDMARSQISHEFFLSIFGSLTNLIGILIVIYRGLFRQSLLMFFVNLLVCNFLMYPVGLTFRAVFAFSPTAAMDSSTLRRV